MSTDTITTKLLPFTRVLVPADSGWSVSKISQHPGSDGVAFNATIKRDGKIVGELINDGRGGDDTFHPTSLGDTPGAYREMCEAWAAFVAKVAEINPEQTFSEQGFTLPVDAGQTLITEYEEVASAKRRKTTAFTVPDPGDGNPIDTTVIREWKLTGKGAPMPTDAQIRNALTRDGDTGPALIWRADTSTWAPLP